MSPRRDDTCIRLILGFRVALDPPTYPPLQGVRRKLPPSALDRMRASSLSAESPFTFDCFPIL